MEQLAVYFSNAWVPATGLSPIVDIWTKDWSKIINDWALYELAWGRYIYNFNEYNNDKVYVYTFDGWATLWDTDRYKAGWNELDAYSNKYSRGRTAIPATNYMPNFQRLEKQMKDTKFPTYDDTQIKGMIDKIGTLISSKTDDSVIKQINDLQLAIGSIRDNMDLSSQNSTMKLQDEVANLMTSLEDIKNNLDISIKNTEDNVASKLEDVHNRLNTNIESKLHPDYLAKHIGKPVEELQKKVEEMFISQVQKNVPENILNQFDIKLIKKDDTNALKQLESMIENV